MLRLRLDEDLRLGPLVWELEGFIPLEEDPSNPYLIALWPESEPWPRWGVAGHFIVDTVGASVGPLGAAQHIGDPQWMVTEVLIGATGQYGWRFELQESIVLEAGIWRLWFALPGSRETTMRLELPESTLASFPVAGSGCGRVAPGDYEADVMLYAGVVGITRNAKWHVELEESRTLVGFVMSSPGLRTWELEFAFPDGDVWRHTHVPLSAESSPAGWPLALGSGRPGVHTLTIMHDVEASLVPVKTVLYCMA